MATITASHLDAPTRPPIPRAARVRAVLADSVRRGTQMVSAARLSPALTIGGLTSGVASAWTTFGLGAGLAALCVAFFVFDWSRD